MIIDKTYFIGEINIPGLQSTDVQAKLNVFINKYESEYLELALGYSFAKLFAAGLAADTPPTKWTDLKDGAEYENADGITKKWKGLSNSMKNSPIANYVYYWHTRDNATYTAPMGEVKGKSENSVSTSGAIKQMRAYNAMVDMTRSLHEFLLCKKASSVLVYTEFKLSEATCFDKISFL